MGRARGGVREGEGERREREQEEGEGVGGRIYVCQRQRRRPRLAHRNHSGMVRDGWLTAARLVMGGADPTIVMIMRSCCWQDV